MKKSIFSILLAGALLSALPNFLFAQNTPLADTTQMEALSEASAEECGGYQPYARYHLVTDVDGLRLRQKPSKDETVLATLPKNTRLVFYGTDCRSEIMDITFSDGIPRRGRWASVSVWKNGSLSGWVFSGALTLVYVQYDAEFGGGLECLANNFFDVQRIDSTDFEQRFAQSTSKQEKMGQSALASPDGRYGLRNLNPKQDKMAGLEFIFQQTGGNPKKVTLEMVYGNKLRRVAWAKESGKLLIEWKEDEMGIVHYTMGVPETRAYVRAGL